LSADKSGVVEDGGRRYFLNVYNPPLRMIVVGAVHIAQPLARMAALAGYEVVIVDPRRAFATAERFPGVTLIGDWPDDALTELAPDVRTAVVTLTHDPKIDDPALTEALNSEAFYVGALGSTRTHAKRLQRLRDKGFDERALGRIHGPVGLDIGALSPAEIAVSIIAEITQVRRGGGAARDAAA
jgi:xanthine dehydrogenase accessory factor